MSNRRVHAPAALLILLCVSGCPRPDGGTGSSSSGTMCPPGTSGCPCQADGSCTSGSHCVGGTCQGPSTGALGGACRPDGTCAVDAVWGALHCMDGACQPECPAGSLGCTCQPQQKCDSFGVQLTSCLDGTCVLASCDAAAHGTLGCACDNGTCAGTATCLHGVCRDATVLGVSMVRPEARSCDILLRAAPDTSIRGVLFGAAVRGREVQRGRDLALAMIARADAPLGERAAVLDVFPLPTGSAPALEIIRATCADKDGNPLSGIVVRLE